MALKDRLNDILAIDPSDAAVEWEGRWQTWSELANQARLVELCLDEAGVPKGAPVGVLIRNRPGQFAGIIGLILAGRAIVTLNPHIPSEVLASEIGRLKLPAVLGEHEDWVPAIHAAAKAVGTVGLMVAHTGTNPASHVPGLERAGKGPFHACGPGVLVEMLTSGTTGAPKRISISADAFERSLDGGNWSRNPDTSARPKLRSSPNILYAPMVHISGFYRGIFGILEGRKTILMDRFAIGPWLDAVRRFRPKTIGLPPAAMRMVLDADVPAQDLAGLISVSSGTAPLSPETKAEFERRYGIPVLCNYGATEFLGPIATWTLSLHQEWAAAKQGSVGRAIAGVELRCVDPDTGKVVPAGERGILEVRATRFGDNAAWVRTTDLASIDEDGFLFVHGRSDAAIIRGGFKILPEVVVAALERHPAVREASVVGLKDPRLGEIPVAAVELIPGGKVSESELDRFARQHLIAYQVPVRFKIVDALPRTPSMKVSQPDVRAMFG